LLLDHFELMGSSLISVKVSKIAKGLHFFGEIQNYWGGAPFSQCRGFLLIFYGAPSGFETALHCMQKRKANSVYRWHLNVFLSVPGDPKNVYGGHFEFIFPVKSRVLG